MLLFPVCDGLPLFSYARDVIENGKQRFSKSPIQMILSVTLLSDIFQILGRSISALL
jgi:hypothetical protein